MKATARVTVIGGGIVGCSILYHLAKKGWTDVVLLERRELTCGSSWHAAGGLFTITQPNSAAELHRYAFRIYPVLEEEAGQPCGFHSTGGINVCRTQDEIDSNAAMQSACRRLGIESHFISLEEAKARAPILDTSRMIGALWEEEGGHVDPASATQAFAAAARRLGATVHRSTPAVGTSQNRDGSWEVLTENGSILSEYVVNAAGLWGREVGRMAGIELPLMPVEHQYLVTDDIALIEDLDFELPQINDNETGCYARQEGQGLLLGAYERSCTHWAKTGTPLEFGHELLPEDLGRLQWNFEKSAEIMPCLEEAGIRRVINGPMTLTPDLGPLVGPHPALRNYFCANGVMAGFNQGAGIGRVVADWIVEGEPGLDIFCWDVARFGPWADRTYTEAATGYFYARRCEKVFPCQEFDAGRPGLKTRIHDRLAAAGGVFGASFGIEHPNWFATGSGASDSLTFRQPNWWNPVADEGRRIRNEAGLMDYSAMAKFAVSGPGAADWLDRIVANRLPEPGRMVLAPMLSDRGRVIGDLSVARTTDDGFMVFGADPMQLCFARHFRRFLPCEGVNVTDLSRALAGLHVCGPNSQALIAGLAEHDMSSSGFPFLSAKAMTIAGIKDVVVLRVSFTGECGYEMYLPGNRHPALFEAILREGARLGLGLVGTRSLMHTRLEKSFPTWGLEISPDYTALDCNLMTHVRPDKGTFIGRDAVLAYGSRKERFATFTVDAGDCAVWGGEAVFLEGETVGYVSSGGWGPHVEAHVALGYVAPDAYREGGDYAVEVLGQLRAARLHGLPLYDPDGTRMRA